LKTVLDAGLGGASILFFQSFKMAFLSRNLNENTGMPISAYFLEKV